MKKKLLGAIGILLAGLVTISGIACEGNEEPTSAAEETPSGFAVYLDEEHGLQLFYPETWQKSYPIGTSVAFNSPDEDEYQENVTVLIATCDDMSLDEYVAASEEELSFLIEDIVISDKEQIEVNGRNGHEWTLSYSNEETQFKLKQVVFIENGKCYCITCSATQDSFDDSVDTFNEIINSFTLDTLE